MIGWMGNPAEDQQPSWDRGWVHLLTLPRELRLVGGKLLQRPIREVEDLLPLTAAAEPVVRAVGRWHEVVELSGACHHRLALTACPGVGRTEVSWHDVDGGEVRLQIAADGARVDRGASRYSDEGFPEGGPMRSRGLEASETHEVEAFFDGSALEIFLDGGACVFTLRAYLGESVGVRVRCVPGADPGAESAAGLGVSDEFPRAEGIRTAVLAKPRT